MSFASRGASGWRMGSQIQRRHAPTADILALHLDIHRRQGCATGDCLCWRRDLERGFLVDLHRIRPHALRLDDLILVCRSRIAKAKMNWADIAVPLVAHFEGCEKRIGALIYPYLDKLAKPAMWTRGYGRTYGITEPSPPPSSIKCACIYPRCTSCPGHRSLDVARSCHS